MRRDAVIGLAVPGRELDHADIGREELQRAGQLLHPPAVAADHGEADGGLVRPGRDRPREVGDDEPFGTLGDVGKGQCTAGREQRGRRFGRRFHASWSTARNALMRSYSGVACSAASTASPVSAA